MIKIVKKLFIVCVVLFVWLLGSCKTLLPDRYFFKEEFELEKIYKEQSEKDNGYYSKPVNRSIIRRTRLAEGY